MRSLLFFIIISLVYACSTPLLFMSDKKLAAMSFPSISKQQIIGSYHWALRDHSSEIELFENGYFVNKINNSFYKGFRKGQYEIRKSVLILKSDSLVYKEWSDILNDVNITHRKSDSSRFEFLVTTMGLHEKQKEGSYSSTPSYKRK